MIKKQLHQPLPPEYIDPKHPSLTVTAAVAVNAQGIDFLPAEILELM